MVPKKANALTRLVFFTQTAEVESCPHSNLEGASIPAMSQITLNTPGTSYYQNVRKEVEPLVPKTLDSVLEIGCGAGATMNWLRSNRPIRYAAGVELFSEAGETARSIFDAVEINDIDSASLEFAQDQFELILALDVLEHLRSPETIVLRLKDKLTPSGTFIASLPNVAHHTVSLPLLFRGAWEYRNSGLLDRTHLRFFNKRSAVALFTDAGLDVVEVKTVRRPPNFFGIMSHRNLAVRWYGGCVLNAVFFWPRHLFDFQFLIAARRRTT